jgi:hypothetical protein
MLNPDKFKSQQSFLSELKEATISGQVVKSRESIQKGREHLTPQGLIESYPDDGRNK